MGITGYDQVQESKVDVEILNDLHFGNCRLQIQVPEHGPYTEPKQLVGKTIVSSFTELTREYFAKLEGIDLTKGDKLQTKIKYVGGSVEASCALGVADGIADLVESGETMRAAGLKAIDTILTTSAHLIASKNPTNPELLEIIRSRIEGVLAAKKYVLCNYNASRDILPTVLKLTPGRRAATVSPIEDENWVAVSSMVEQDKIAAIMDDLKKAGASDILVLTISNCRV